MRKVQKFKRGNKVKVLFGHPIWGSKTGVTDISPEEVGQEALIVGSYADQFGGDDRENYTIMFCETGNEVSWKSEDQLELIDKGGEHLFKEAKKNRKRISRQNKDIKYINSKLDEGKLSSESILLLFDMLGHNTSFHKNGEFFVLFSDWAILHPVFVHIKNAKTLKESKSIFTKEGLHKYNVEKIYNAFHNNNNIKIEQL